MVALCFALVAAVALVDGFTWNINLAILYTLPLVLYGHLRPARKPWPLVLVLVALTYAGFLFGPGGVFSEGASEVTLSYRLVNRTLTAITLAIVGGLQQLGVAAAQKIERGSSAGPNPRQATVDDLMQVVDQLRGAAISLIIAFSIAALDMLSPATFNLPILYAIPLLTCLQVGSRPLLWSLAGVVFVLSGVGYLLGIDGMAAPIHNRLIAAASILLVAWMGHRWLAPEQRALGTSAPAGAAS